MQNPFRNRPQDDFGRRDHDEDRHQMRADDWRHDEARSWRGDDDRSWTAQGGYDRDEAYREGRQQGYGRNEGRRYGQGGESAYAGRSSWQASQDLGRDWPGSNRGYGHSNAAAYDTRDNLRDWADRGRSDDYGYDRQRQSQARSESRYPDRGYAPGAQIWEDRDQDYRASHRDYRRHDFEPDYLHWREQQMNNLDRDYSAWRDERRQKFSSDFDSWRQTRASKDATPADNSKIGDITDGEAHSPVVKTKS